MPPASNFTPIPPLCTACEAPVEPAARHAISWHPALILGQEGCDIVSSGTALSTCHHVSIGDSLMPQVLKALLKLLLLMQSAGTRTRLQLSWVLT